MNITDVCIKKPVFAWMLMAATVLFGVVAASRIGISQFPDVDFPTVTVQVTYEGASPEVIEKDILVPLEDTLSQVEGRRSLTSIARQGSGQITIELDMNRPVEVALQDVQTRVAQVRLPVESDPPRISKTNPEDQSIMYVGVSGPFSAQLLNDVARYQVADALQAIDGVGEVSLHTTDRAVRVWLDANELAAHDLTVGDVTTALQAQHIELPAGQLRSGGREVSVRIMGEVIDIGQLERVVVSQAGGQPVRLSDVAIVEDGFQDVQRRSLADGEPVQGMGIRKQRGANAVSVARGVRATLAELQKTMPAGMTVRVLFDSTQFIEESVHEIEFELLLAIVLTALVCWLFLGSLSSTLNVILAVPMSLLGTVAVIYFLGFTLNTFTLLALSLAVGIVVDDAIMVMENIFRHAELGKDRVRAAREGTREITFAALAATLAVIAIFIPVVFMQGVTGKFFLQFGVTLCIAIALSYVEAITLAPARCAQLLDTSRHARNALGRAVDRGFERLATIYERLLRRALAYPGLVLIVGVGLVGAAWFALDRVPSEFVPSQDQSRLRISMQAAVGSNIDETEGLAQKAQAVIDKVPEIAHNLMIVGGTGRGGQSNRVQAMVTLVPASERKASQAEVQQRLRGALNAIPGLRAAIQDPSQQGFTAQRGQPIEFTLRGNDWDQLVNVASDVRDKLASSGLATDVDTDYQLGAPELQVVPNRALAADAQVSVHEIAAGLSALVGGLSIGEYTSHGRRIEVRVELLAAQRQRPEDLGRLLVRSATGALLPLASLVRHEERPALQTITRREKSRAITVTANVAPGHSQAEALAWVEELGKTVPEGTRLVLSGAAVTFKESFSGLIFALGLGILIAYMVLASQFNSFLHPITVLTILPLSVAGAAVALWASGKTLNVFSMIGLLLLMGIVKKNSIILVDFATQRQAEGADAHAAMLAAGPARLRPILMTSIATLMAALPSALALGPGAEVRGPMAVAIIGGLAVSTLLSLLVVPAFYVVSDRLKLRFGRRKPHLEQAA
jgi:hydrophobe/amphiphile efflux-1 (HAE1) family protein